MKSRKPLANLAPAPARRGGPARGRPGRPRKPFVRKPVALEHHERRCAVCRHPLRRQIEQEFLHWVSPKTIAKDYRLGNGNPCGLYRHARAVGLWEKRFSWVRDSLAPLIEQAGRLVATPAAVVSAVRTVAQINAVGQWVEPADRVYLRDLFEHMTSEEMELYAREGKLPAWFEKTISATPGLFPEPTTPKENGSLPAPASPKAGLPAAASPKPGDLPNPNG